MFVRPQGDTQYYLSRNTECENGVCLFTEKLYRSPFNLKFHERFFKFQTVTINQTVVWGNAYETIHHISNISTGWNVAAIKMSSLVNIK